MAIWTTTDRDNVQEAIRDLATGSRVVQTDLGGKQRELHSTSLQALRIAVVEDSVRWDGDELQRSMGALDVVEGRDGLRVLSTARQIAVVKVAAWAAREVRQRGDDPVLV